MFIQPTWPAPAHIKAYTTLRTADPHPVGNIPLPSDPIWLDQHTHSAIAVEATISNKKAIADASFTNQINRVCAVLTADCLPVLICNRQGTHVAAIHAGWRGLASGIVEAALAGLNQPSEEVLVWLGPAIGPSKFEVGSDVYDAFVSQSAESECAFKAQPNHKWLADLYELARIRLHKQGVQAIYGGEYCTYTEADKFYSYRRDKGNTGRLASLIWIT